MKKNLKTICVMSLIIAVFGFIKVNAAKSNLTATVVGTTPKYSQDFDCLRDYPGFYASSLQYSDAMFAVKRKKPSALSNYMNLKVGSTSSIASLGSLNGYTIQAVFKSKSYHIANTIAGIMFH